MGYKKSDYLELFTLKLERKKKPNPKRKGDIFIKHCMWSEQANCYLRPVKYANALGQRKPVNDIDEEIGWEWVPVIEDDYKIVHVEKEKKDVTN